MRIIFVRHGEPNYEKDCLTPLGKLQAQAAAERLAEEGISAVYSSPQGRARTTAEIAAARLGISPVQILPGMHEIAWGADDGTEMPHGGNPWSLADEMMREGFDLTRSDWRNHPLFQNNRATSEAARVANETDAWLSQLGYTRKGPYYLCEQTHEAEKAVALFSHGGSSTAVLARLLNLPCPYLCATLHMPFTGITILRLDHKAGDCSLPRLELAGDGRHIHGLALP